MKIENLLKKLTKLNLTIENNKILISDKMFINIIFSDKSTIYAYELCDYRIFFDNFNKVLNYLKCGNYLVK